MSSAMQEAVFSLNPTKYLTAKTKEVTLTREKHEHMNAPQLSTYIILDKNPNNGRSKLEI
jgi:hypothetical protein